MSDLVVQISGLSRRFGETQALNELSMEIPRGLVYGLVGANGAGKTTLIIRTVADDGRTVLFSSHLLDEVEQMSDHVFLIDQGCCVLEGSLDEVKGQHHHLVVEFDGKHQDLPAIEGVISAVGSELTLTQQKTWKLVSRGDSNHLESSVQSLGGTVAKQRGASLEEIFVAHVGRDRLTTTSEE